MNELFESNDALLTELLGNIKDVELREFLTFFFYKYEDIYTKFMSSPGARGHHHAFDGGLAFHSLNAAMLAQQIAQHYNDLGIKVDEDIVIAGVLIHDIGKIHCYTKECPNNKDNKPYGKCFCDKETVYHHVPRASLYHHIPLGVIDIVRAADTWDGKISQDKIDKLAHIILSHHGRKAWSSPVLPQFVEAYIVHSVEMMDGYVDKFAKGEVPSTIYDGVNY